MADQQLLRDMGERIYMRRKNSNMTQNALAEKLGVSPQMISNLELGKKAIRPENLLRLCEVLDLSADYVLTGKGENDSVERLTKRLKNFSDDDIRMVDRLISYIERKNTEYI